MAGLLLLELLHYQPETQKTSIKRSRFHSESSRGSPFKDIKSVTPEKHACRVCLKEGNIPIFELGKDISRDLNTFGGIEVSSEDIYPKYMCEECHSLLQGAILFRKRAQDSDQRLRKYKQNFSSIEHNLSLHDSDDDNQDDSQSMSFDYHVEKVEFKKETDKLSKDGNRLLKYPILSQNYAKSYKHLIKHNKIDKTTNITHQRISQATNKEFNSQIKLRTPGTIPCSICKQKYAASYIERHLALHKKVALRKAGQLNKKYECKRCSLDFKSKNEYIDHKKSEEHSKKTRTCPVCQKTYGHLYFRNHLMTHVKEKQYVCDICGKGFRLPNCYSIHRLIHFDILPHKCSYCPYRGRTKSLLNIHIRSHTGERPYQCDQCPSRFITKSNLSKHILTHKKDRDYMCSECHRGFHKIKDLDMHTLVEHAGVKSSVCDICQKAFGYRKEMLKHQAKCHNREKMRSGRMPSYLLVKKKQEEEKDS